MSLYCCNVHRVLWSIYIKWNIFIGSQGNGGRSYLLYARMTAIRPVRVIMCKEIRDSSYFCTCRTEASRSIIMLLDAERIPIPKN